MLIASRSDAMPGALRSRALVDTQRAVIAAGADPTPGPDQCHVRCPLPRPQQTRRPEHFARVPPVMRKAVPPAAARQGPGDRGPPIDACGETARQPGPRQSSPRSLRQTDTVGHLQPVQRQRQRHAAPCLACRSPASVAPAKRRAADRPCRDLDPHGGRRVRARAAVTGASSQSPTRTRSRSAASSDPSAFKRTAPPAVSPARQAPGCRSVAVGPAPSHLEGAFAAASAAASRFGARQAPIPRRVERRLELARGATVAGRSARRPVRCR